jgi:hypothetical protein
MHVTETYTDKPRECHSIEAVGKVVEELKALKWKITGDKKANLCNCDVAASKQIVFSHVGGTAFGWLDG